MKKLWILATLVMFLLAAPLAAARPVLDIDLVSQDPQPATPGQLVDIILKVENKGDTEARGAKVELVETFPISVADGETIKDVGFVPFLDTSNPLLVRFKVDLDDNSPDGDVPFKVRLTYEGAEGFVEEEFDLDVRSADASIAISEVSTAPAKVVPGQIGKVFLTLENTAGTSLRDVSVKLDLASADLPFTPTGTATTQKIPFLRSQQSTTIEYSFITDAEAEPKAYKIPLNLTFQDNLNNEFSQTDTIGVQVGAEPEIVVYFDETTVTSGSTTGEVALRIVNKGFTDVKFLTTNVANADGVTVLTSPEVYVGNLDSDDFETVSYRVQFNTPVIDTIEMPVTLEFRDTNNRLYELNQNIVVRAQPNTSNGGPSPVVIVVVLVVIVALIWWFFKRRNKDED